MDTKGDVVMIEGPSIQRYAAISAEDSGLLFKFSDVHGFYTGNWRCLDSFADESPAEPGRRTMRITGVDFSQRPDLAEGVQLDSDGVGLDDVWIGILSNDGSVIGQYLLADARLTSSELSGYLYDVPRVTAERVWEIWRQGRPREINSWESLPVGERESWLEVVARYSFGPAGRINATGDPREYSLAGSRIRDIASFFCALGEAVNGPGGYFGWNFSALHDCLMGGWGALPGFSLDWDDAGVSASFLSGLIQIDGNSISLFDFIIESLERDGVRVVLR